MTTGWQSPGRNVYVQDLISTEYAGENKKSVFSLLNYLFPEKGVMAVHCSANHAKDDPEDAAVFFGLSGTGKTTLSADPDLAGR